MTTYGIQGTDVPVLITFVDTNGDPVIPDAASATYSIRLNDGSLDPDHTDVAIDLGNTDTSTIITINDSITGQLETRTLIVSYRRAAVPRTIRTVVRLVQEPLHWVAPEDVRAYIGVSVSELPDRDIDLQRAYLEAQADVGVDVFTAAFQTNMLKANDLVLARAAWNILPSLDLRIAQSETNGTKAYARLSKLDLDRLRWYIIGLYGSLVAELTGVELGGNTLFLLSTQADPITGV